MTSKYQQAADHFLARGLDESVEQFNARKSAIVAIADTLKCGVWHAAHAYHVATYVGETCYLCGGEMPPKMTVAHPLCEARTNRGLTDLPVMNYEPKCGCNWVDCPDR